MADEWIIDLTKQLESPPPSTDNELWTRSIYRVSKILTDVNSQAYEPKLASFGPYHHDRRHLRPMEKHKHRALIQFLRRIGRASKSPEDVLVAMKRVEPSLRFSYDSLQTEDAGVWTKDEFLKVMITDGCFALEVMLAETRFAFQEQREYHSHDPVFGRHRKNYVIPDLKRDMLLMENQLPLLALTTLADMEGSGIGDVINLIKSFYNISSTSPDDLITEESPKLVEQSFHILDLYRKIMTANGNYFPSCKESVLSATKLRNAGISFCRSATKNFNDISFVGGKLSLPLLEIDDTTESLMLNLMALERLHATTGNKVTAYVFFMNGLINTTDDVDLLRTEEIIMGWAGCDNNIVSLFNRITKVATLVIFRDDILIDVTRTMNDYCKKKKHKWKANFVDTYLKYPWILSSLIGGLVLLGLTVMQTVYTVISYYNA
ncbi:putative UPF0481 protein [Platanthera zijinensis]|uniref:UPF0481 protein n=1 Tax=Platanthera zijinensis TaxID=2320716 RepID=A0AAP0BNU9_9ASPA